MRHLYCPKCGARLGERQAGDDGAVLCFGSLYTIGAIRDALTGMVPASSDAL